MAASGPSRGHARLRVGEQIYRSTCSRYSRVGLSRPCDDSSRSCLRVVPWPQVDVTPRVLLGHTAAVRCRAASHEVRYRSPAGLGSSVCPISSLSLFWSILIVGGGGRPRRAFYDGLPIVKGSWSLGAACVSPCWERHISHPLFFFTRPQIGRDYPLNLSI